MVLYCPIMAVIHRVENVLDNVNTLARFVIVYVLIRMDRRHNSMICGTVLVIIFSPLEHPSGFNYCTASLV